MTHKKKTEDTALACAQLHGIGKTTPDAEVRINRVCTQYGVKPKFIKKLLTLT
jgi:hypothetical protein